MDPQTAADSTNNGNPMLGIIILVIAIAVFAWLLITLQRAAATVPEPERRFKPGLVWLTVIPFFNTIWWFFVVTRIPESLRCALIRREESHGDCGRDIGLVFAALGATGTGLIFAGGLAQAIARGFEAITADAGGPAAEFGGSLNGLGVLMILGGIACLAVFVARVHGAASRLRDLDSIIQDSSE
ncbi:MAG: hypothetical protein P8J59_03695 [Phycisphaerales bacterium]|jgi:hypothetical protein|nr:hypothetical protein [Phycisphaerales bacterium]